MRVISRLSGGKATRLELYVVAVVLFAGAGGISYAAVSTGGPPGAAKSSSTTTSSVPTSPAPTSTNTPPTPTTATTTTPPSPALEAPPGTTTTLAGPTPIPNTAPPPPTGPGTANLTYSGVLSGPLMNAVSYCQPRPNAESEITVNGTLNGTPWVLFIQSYDGETGVWQVLTGQSGGGTGLVGQGYRVTASYPQTVPRFTQIDWAHGATFNVQQLASGPGQAPAGDVEVQGTIACG